MSINYLHKKSNTASKRPTAASLDIGEVAVNYESGTPGLFFEDSSGLVRKVGPVEVSGTAPNSSPAGSSGNSIGEQWLDTSVTPSVLKTWDGSAWTESGGQASTLDGPVTFTAQANGTLALGDVVYISGAAGDTPIVSKAQANSASTMPAYGFVSEAISSGSTGKIITFGSVEGDGSNPLDTSSLTVNDVVYVSATTAGAWTTTKPTGEANLLQNIGRIQRVNSQNGVIKVGGAGRASATPNLDDGNIFVGNASNESVSDAFTDVLAAQSGITTNASDLTVDRHILPDTNITYDLGSATQRFRDIYLSTNTIYMGETTLSVDSSTGTLAVGGEDLVKASDPVVTGDVNLADNASIDLFERAANGTDHLAFKAPTSLSGTQIFILPDGDGTENQVLRTDGAGNLAWRSVTTAVAPIFSGNPSLTNAGEFRWLEATANGTNYVAFKAPDSVTADTVLTLPDGDGSSNQVLTTNGSGVLSWATPSASGTTGLGTTASATVLSLSDSLINATQPIGLDNQKALRYYELDTNGSNYVAFQAPAAVTTTTTFTLPDGDGSNKQVLRTNGSGTLAWSRPIDAIVDNSSTTMLTFDSNNDIITDSNAHLDVAEYTFYVDGTNYRCGINTNGPDRGLDIYGYENPDTIGCYSFQPNDFAPSIYFIKGRGSNNDNQAAAANDRLGMQRYFGYDGTNEVYGAQSYVETQDTSMNTCTYHWQSNISGTSAERLQISSTGELKTQHGFIADNNTSIKLNETTANGTNYIALKAPASVTADTTLTLPDGDGVSGQTMITDGSGTLSFGGFGINAHASFNATSGGSFSWATDKIAEGNITSVTRTAEGKFTVTFDRDFASNAYTCVGSAGAADHSGTGAGGRSVNVVSRSAGSVDIVVERADDGVNTDDGYISIMVIGVLS